jgi:hypothetical protein
VGVSESLAKAGVLLPAHVKGEERPCAESIVTRLAAKAYGRDVEEHDVSDLMTFYTLGAEEGGFEIGVRTALEAILVSPHFLYRMEREPADIAPGEVYRIADIDLASALSSCRAPIQQRLLRRRAQGTVGRRAEETARMLADSAEALARFAARGCGCRTSKWGRTRSGFPTTAAAHGLHAAGESFFDELVRQDRNLLGLWR